MSDWDFEYPFNPETIKKLTPMQAKWLWNQLDHRLPLSDPICLHQEWPILPYISTAEGEINRLQCITSFLYSWYQAMEAYTTYRENEVKEAARNARKAGKKQKASAEQVQDENPTTEPDSILDSHAPVPEDIPV